MRIQKENHTFMLAVCLAIFGMAVLFVTGT